MPAAICTWCQTYLTIVERTIGPRSEGNTRIRRHWQRDRSSAGGRLERPIVSNLSAHWRTWSSLQRIPHLPLEATQFRRSQASEDRSQQHGPVAPAVEMGDDGPYSGGGCHASFEPVLRPARRQDRSYGSGDCGRGSAPPAPGPDLRGTPGFCAPWPESDPAATCPRTRARKGRRAPEPGRANHRRDVEIEGLSVVLSGDRFVCAGDCRLSDAAVASERRGV
jgi:hypothetical protein